ncbi:rod shape-determining protein MreD [Bacteroidota bacterium]
MGRVLLQNTLRFIALVLMQVIILDNVQLFGYMNPQFYILFILLLPFDTPRWLILVVGFFLGLSIDLFTNTLGMHTAATVFLAFLRPWILKIFSPRDGYEADSSPTIRDYGINWFLRYALFATFMHHLFLFYVEVFNFHEFFSTFLRVILSTMLTAILIIISQYFIFRR